MLRQRDEMIRMLAEYCGLDLAFINEILNSGLLEMNSREDIFFIAPEDVEKAVRISRLHHRLDINLEGVEVILHMRENMMTMQQELEAMRRRIRLYEALLDDDGDVTDIE